MKILLFGKNGQLGWELNRSLQPLGDVIALGREEADFSDHESLRDVVRNIKPHVIVNATSYTQVDKAGEEDEQATIINGIAPGVLAEDAKRLNALLVHYSTDYVFDGKKVTPYSELDKPNPINAYGRSKLAGEQSIMLSGCDYIILRTSWVYSDRGNNFLLKIIQLAYKKEELNIVCDQRGAPIWVWLIADRTAQIISFIVGRRNSGIFCPGTYHLVTRGCTTWYEFAKQIIKEAESLQGDNIFLVKNINPVSSDEFITRGQRPKNTCLSIELTENKFGIEMPEWDYALKLYFKCAAR